MPLFEKDSGIAGAFLELLSVTLDVESAIKELGITKEQASEILRSVASKKAAEARARRNEPSVEPCRIAAEPHKEAAGKRQVYSINVDGASRGNPGKAGAGAVIKDGRGNAVKKLKAYIGIATNNAAEYSAIIMALKAAKEMGIKEIKVFADSELMVKQLNGVYRVKSEDLKPFYLKAMELIKGFESCKIAHVYREDNSVADALANEAIDGAGK